MTPGALSKPGWMHQKHPPARTAVRDVVGDGFCAGQTSITSTLRTANRAEQAWILFILQRLDSTLINLFPIFVLPARSQAAISEALTNKEVKMVKPAAILFGLVFLVVGVLGYVPAATSNEMLLGIFHVNSVHNIIHLASGVVFLLCGLAGPGPSRTFFRIFGIVYAAVAALGFYY